jgi:hypothetical protein
MNRKLWVIDALLGSMLLMGCASGSQEPLTPPSPATHMAHCQGNASQCFEEAARLCQSSWHPVAEPGMAFPALIADGSADWKMLFTCEKE